MRELKSSQRAILRSQTRSTTNMNTTTRQELTQPVPPEPRRGDAPSAQKQSGGAGPQRTPRVLRHMLSLDDFEAAARRVLPRPIFGYISGGSETDASLRGNREAFAEYQFMPRVLVSTRGRHQKTTLFGRTYDLPFGFPPMGGTALAAYEGDNVLARVAAELNIPMIQSGASLTKLERLKEVGPTAWFQAYLPGAPEIIVPLVERAQNAGFDTLVLT